MDVAELLLDVLLILAFAKVGAELAERMKVPAVIGEIVAGLVLGPSLLGWVELNETIKFLAEFGVILLLLQVGMEMDLAEMRKVGGSAVAVAVFGVVVPMGLGYGAAVAFGHGGNQALFLGAALAATSVGITARAFGDLRMLSSVEARVVLGAAVVDDILGLVILTVVVRIVQEGSVDALAAVELLAVAVAFLVVTTALGLRFAPPAFRWVQRNSRSSGTLLIAALGLTLGLALLAHEVELAVIIGAFVAGLALGRTRQSERIERDITPLATFFVPIFFVSVGLEVDVKEMLKPEVLAFAGALLAAAIVGKLMAGAVIRRRGEGAAIDRLLVGIGMIPRGEVGLIFASIGITTGVLTDDLYAALLIVVLVTTIITPPAIRIRIGRRTAQGAAETSASAPPGGWLVVGDDTVALSARPADAVGLAVALEAARLVADDDPDPGLVAWMGELADGDITWSTEARTALAELLAGGNRRSWRLLDATGLLAAALPGLADEIDHRRRDTSLLDPAHLMRLPIVERLAELIGPDGDERARTEAALLTDPRVLHLAALALDLSTDYEDAAVAAGDLIGDIAVSPGTGAEIVAAATDATLLRSAALHLASLSRAVTPDVVAHVGTVERARRIYLLGLALGDLDETHRNALEELYAALVHELSEARPEGASDDAVQRRRAAVAGHLGDPRLKARLQKAPAALLLEDAPGELAADLALLGPGVPPPGAFPVAVTPTGPGRFRIAVAGRDELGLFARITQALAALGCDIGSAAAGEFPDGAVLDVFHVAAAAEPDADRIGDAILAAFATPLVTGVPAGTTVAIDHLASPWYTVCSYTTTDEAGVLARMAATISAQGVAIHGARVTSGDGEATGRFDLSDARGRKLSPATTEALADVLTPALTQG